MGKLYSTVLKIPERNLINQPITKVFFQRYFSLLADEKRFLKHDIESMLWYGRIKPDIANIPAYMQDDYSFEELQVMICFLREPKADKLAQKCAALFQKYIPYQIVLWITDGQTFVLNTCDKRINQSDSSKRTVVEYYSTPPITTLYKREYEEAFYHDIQYTQLDKTDLRAMYQSYTRAILRYKAAQLTGNAQQRLPRTQEAAEWMKQVETLQQEIHELVNRINKEKQFNRQVEMNVAIQKKRQEIEAYKTKLNNQ